MTRATQEREPWRPMSRHGLYQEINQVLVGALDIRDGDTVVDLGCGDGLVSQILLDRHGDAVRIWAVDPDDDMLADARAHLGAHVGTCAATAETFGDLFPPASCDAVILANALHLVRDRQALYRNLRRVLVPGGAFAFNTTFYGSDRLRPSTAFVMGVGFQVRSLARRRGIDVPPARRMAQSEHLVKPLPSVDELVTELRAVPFDVDHVEERPWMLDAGFMSSFMSAPYEATILLPDVDMATAGDLIREACDEFAAKKPEPVPRPWLTLVVRMPS